MMRYELRRAVAALLGAGLAGIVVAGPASAQSVSEVSVDFRTPVSTDSAYAWGGFFDPTKMYDVSDSASEVRLAFPVGTDERAGVLTGDLDPATARLGMSLSDFPGHCVSQNTTALRMEGWTLVLDPAAMAASSTGACVAANPGSGYNVWIDAQDARDRLRLWISVRLDPTSTTTDVTLRPISASQVHKSYVTATTPAAPGGTIRLSGIGDTFESSNPHGTLLLSADGQVVSNLHPSQVSQPFSTASTIDVRLPSPLPAGAATLLVRSQAWGGPLLNVHVPLGPPPPVEVDPVARYVDRVYTDLLKRSPDPAGLSGWTAALKQGTPYQQVANGITNSAEFRAMLITGSYQRYLGRGTDPVGLRDWLAAMGVGLHIEQMQAGFIASEEFYNRSSRDDRQWIANLYRTVLNRAPATTEIDAWQRALAAGSSRYSVAIGFLYSTEHLSTVVDGYYQTLLRRGIDPSGQQTWVTAIQRGARDEQIVAFIVTSAEYRAKV